MGDVFATLTFEIDGQAFSLPLRQDESLGLTPREHGNVRRQTGVSGTVGIAEAIQQLDAEVMAALGVAAAKRVGVDVDFDAIADGKCEFAPSIEVADSDPPPAAADAAA